MEEEMLKKIIEKVNKKYFCKSCGYKWESKKKFGEPSICPSCKKNNIIRYADLDETKRLKLLEEETDLVLSNFKW